MTINAGAIILFDFKIRKGQIVILEAGCGFNSGVYRPDNTDLRNTTIDKLTKEKAINAIYLDISLLVYMSQITAFLQIFGKQIGQKVKTINLLIPSTHNQAATSTIENNSVVITCYPDSATADLNTIQYTESRQCNSSAIFMMGNRTVFAITEDKVLLSWILKPTDTVTRPKEKLVSLFQLTHHDIDALPFNEGEKLVLKPTNSAGAYGVIVLQNKQHLKEILQFIKEKRTEFEILNPEMRKALYHIYRVWLREKNEVSYAMIFNDTKSHVSVFYNPVPQENCTSYNKQSPNIFSGKYHVYLDGMDDCIFECNNNEIDILKKFLGVLSGSFLKDLRAVGYSDTDIYSLFYWIFGNHADGFALVQECIQGDPIMINETQYDPTGRVVCYFYELNGEQTFQIVDAFWKLPPSSSDTISFYTDTSRGALMSETDKYILEMALKSGIAETMFSHVLRGELKAILKKMLTCNDKEASRYASYYIKTQKELGYDSDATSTVKLSTGNHTLFEEPRGPSIAIDPNAVATTQATCCSIS